MLKVSEEQLDGIQRGRFSDFVDRMVTLAREEFPEHAHTTREALVRSIEQGLASADRYGFERVMDVERFLYMRWALGEDFGETHDWARDVLSRPDFTPSVRMDVLWAVFEGNTSHPGGRPFGL